MTNVNDNPDREELGFGKVVEDAVGLGVMTADDFKALIHPLTYEDATKLFGVSSRYIKQMAYGERKAKDFGKTRQDVLNFLKTSSHAAKSRQQLRNAVGYKDYVGLVGLDRYKCTVCCYPASESIYRIPLCEGCVGKIKKNKEN